MWSGNPWAGAIFVQGLKIDHVRQLRRSLVGRAAGQALRLDIRDRPGRTTNLNNLPRLRKWRGGGCWGTRHGHNYHGFRTQTSIDDCPTVSSRLSLVRAWFD